MRRLIASLVRLLAGLLALLFVAVLLLVPARPAAAHGTLAMSVPAAGATASKPLTEVRLYFTEKVASNAHFTITVPGGGRVDGGWSHGEPQPLPKPVTEYVLVNGLFQPREYATGFPAVVTVAHLPAVGEYTATYLSVASDGEPVRGTLTFRYTGPVTAAPSGWRPPTDQPDPALLAAVAQHESSGHGSGAATSSAPAPVAAPPSPAATATSTDEGAAVPIGWLGAGVAVVAVIVGLVLWRRLLNRPGGTPARQRVGTRQRRPGGSPAGGARTPARGRTDRRVRSSPKGRNLPPVAVPVDGSPQHPAAVLPDLGASSTRFALLVGALVVSLLAGFGLGRIDTGVETAGTARPAAVTAPAVTGTAEAAGDGHRHAAGAGAHTHPGDGGTDRTQATGTTVSAGGYTLRPERRSQSAGRTEDYRFRVVGTDGRPVTRFAVVHDKPLHLVVVGRDLTGYQHLHPSMAPDGTWSVPLTLPRAGTYRVYADFSLLGPGGAATPLVLGVDHHVPGTYAPATPPPPRPQATAGPFTVTLAGTPKVGTTVPMAFVVGRAASTGPVAVQRYLGAYGHLVVIREGDLGYVHVHPEPELVNGAISFWLTAPGAGRYAAFLDFQVDGTVHTAGYTIDVD
ncbi:copper resistance CopC family protein [Micromonospora schwarzwaldensis]|uniref:copper resistance CopC family protein n=1 Tax=Micromonospora sp. DSM 45708 TaxID=3111767 RepID=UPI0031E35F03